MRLVLEFTDNIVPSLYLPPGRKIKLQEKPAALKGEHPALKKQ
jgi:hypothetical protein